jgi:hypothetical protein
MPRRVCLLRYFSSPGEGGNAWLDRCKFEERIRNVKDLLPLAEQIMRLKIDIGELLAFHCAVYEKAEIERIPPGTGAYKVVEDIRDTYYCRWYWNS